MSVTDTDTDTDTTLVAGFNHVAVLVRDGQGW